ncbi:alpha/beta fold hydrolase [Nocardiopsis sp. N85]|uniref:thioesterase II family protein n=1 Tax=Nocardiopsis sp. N85 TaxID=3029400 RepID=UPI00237F2DF8|nr:alpha/beta fold hydrolase [Nocardiopsis sp. N85]MDE3721848.1 alpha/beta fold hydrolase [Nocardiopsis sp. N85]
MRSVPGTGSPWLRRFHAREGARLTVVLFPHAGGSANFYREWSADLPEEYALLVVQYPGRETRMGEPPVDRMEDLAEGAVAAIEECVSGPYALFGHSMGALVAYESTRRLAKGPLGAPVRLFASARCAPGREGPTAGVHLLDDDGLVAVIEALGGTPPGVLADHGLRSLVLPAVRGDYRLVDTYRPTAPAPVDVPVTALAGADDPSVTPEEVAAWAETTTRGHVLEVLPGDHFFPVRHRAEVLRILARDLAG